MHVGVTYAEAHQQVWLHLEVPAGSTIRDAIECSGILDRFPQIDLSVQKVGIFGKLAQLDTRLKDGDRVEIYRAITADPATVQRRESDTNE